MKDFVKVKTISKAQCPKILCCTLKAWPWTNGQTEQWPWAVQNWRRPSLVFTLIFSFQPMIPTPEAVLFGLIPLIGPWANLICLKLLLVMEIQHQRIYHQNLPNHRKSVVSICKYFVFWTLKYANGPRHTVKIAWKNCGITYQLNPDQTNYIWCIFFFGRIGLGPLSERQFCVLFLFSSSAMQVVKWTVLVSSFHKF